MTREPLSDDNQLFLNEFHSLIDSFENKKLIEKKAHIKFFYVIRIAEFLTIAKPQSHTEIHKSNILNYLRILLSTTNDKSFSKTDYMFLKGNNLYPIIRWMGKYGFRTSYELINFNIYLGLFIDVVIWFFFFIENFYFVPIFSLLLPLKGVIQLQKSKKENKFINL